MIFLNGRMPFYDGIRLSTGEVAFPGLRNTFEEEHDAPWWVRNLLVLVLLVSSVLLLFFTIGLNFQTTPQDVVFSANLFDFGDISFARKRRSIPTVEVDEVFGNQYVKKENKVIEANDQPAQKDAAYEGEGDSIGDAQDFAFLGGGIAPPRLLSRLKEHYPAEAKSLGVTAELYLEIVIDTNGLVRQVTTYPASVRLDRSLAPELESRIKKEFQAAARKTLLGAKYTPIVKDGTAIAVRMGVPFQFQLE